MSIRERLDRNDVMVCEPHSELWRVGRVTGPIDGNDHAYRQAGAELGLRLH